MNNLDIKPETFKLQGENIREILQDKAQAMTFSI
jgi:hypothetical protein